MILAEKNSQVLFFTCQLKTFEKLANAMHILDLGVVFRLFNRLCELVHDVDAHSLVAFFLFQIAEFLLYLAICCWSVSPIFSIAGIVVVSRNHHDVRLSDVREIFFLRFLKRKKE